MAFIATSQGHETIKCTLSTKHYLRNADFATILRIFYKMIIFIINYIEKKFTKS